MGRLHGLLMLEDGGTSEGLGSKLAAPVSTLGDAVGYIFCTKRLRLYEHALAYVRVARWHQNTAKKKHSAAHVIMGR
jgi:hypothetical protein